MKTKEPKIIYLVLIFALIIKIIAMFKLGINYNIASDDLSYINAGKILAETGTITMHGYISAQSMPLLTIFCAIYIIIFGTGIKLFYALKISYLIFGLISIYYLYKIIKLYANEYIAGLIPLFLLTPDFIWMDNMVLMETPYMLLFILVIYNSLKYAKDKKIINLCGLIIFMVLGVYLRPTIAWWIIPYSIYLLLNKYPLKEVILKMGIVLGMVLLALLPWTIRNYIIFNDFTVSYGMGNPKLLGTYQGVNFPSDEVVDYSSLDIKLNDLLKDKPKFNGQSNDPMLSYYDLKRDEIKANIRLEYWWKTDKKSLILSYLFFKPKYMIIDTFYWKELFGISANQILLTRYVEFGITAIMSLIIIIFKKHWKELLLFLSTYAFNLYTYAFGFAFSRYAQTIYFLRYIIIGIGLTVLIETIKSKKQRRKNEKN